LKKFFGWYRDREFVSWLKVGNIQETVGPEDVLTEDELQRIRGKCERARAYVCPAFKNDRLM